MVENKFGIIKPSAISQDAKILECWILF